MAPIKFEDNLREKLQERELQPQADSWGKLASRLDKEMPQKQTGRFGWLAIAATMIGVLLAVTILLNQKDPVPTMVETQVEDPSIEEPMIKNDTQIAIEAVEETNKEEPTLVEKKQQVNKETPVKTTNKKELVVKEPILKNKTEAVVIAQNEIKKEELPVIKTPIETQEEQLINTKVNEVVVAVQNLQQQKEVTAEEIDALLAKAQREIANSKFLESTTAKIDPNALLQDVETELERNFRDRVFDALGNSFNKVRTAVAERNY